MTFETSAHKVVIITKKNSINVQEQPCAKALLTHERFFSPMPRHQRIKKAPKLKKSKILNLDFFDMRGEVVHICRFFPNVNVDVKYLSFFRAPLISKCL